jgi:hypothetical protein
VQKGGRDQSWATSRAANAVGSECVNVLYPESRSDDQMLASRSKAGYRKEVPEDYRMTGQPREDARTTRVTCRVSITIWPLERRG